MQHQEWDWQSKLQESEEALEKCITWLFESQNPDGGWPPYPGEVDVTGTLATADVLVALLRPLPREAPKPYMIWEPSEKRESLVRAINFLLKIRNGDNGFPPLGDIYSSELSLPDSTTDAALALFSCLFAVTNVGLQTSSAQIEDAIVAALRWLDRTKLSTPEHAWWPTVPDHSDMQRTFPTLLSCLALDISLERSVDGRFKIDEPLKQAISTDLRKAIKWLLSCGKQESDNLRHETHYYLPFRRDRPQKQSIAVTAMCSRLFYQLSRKVIHIRDGELFDRGEKEELARVGIGMKNWLEKRVREWKYTDEDDLEIPPAVLKSPLSVPYPATYARLPTVLITFLELSELESLKQNKAFREGLTSLLHEIKSWNCYREDRLGGRTEASSATAIAVLFLRDLLYKFNQMRGQQ